MFRKRGIRQKCEKKTRGRPTVSERHLGRKREGGDLYFRPNSLVQYTFDTSLDYETLLTRYELAKSFSKQSIKETELITKEKIERELTNRESCLDELIITIDGENAKDFDDGISIRFEEGIYVVGVHIADVSFLVPMDSMLDKQSYIRGNSTYLLDRVIPMLPIELSENQCSLVQGEIRLTFSCEIKLDIEGGVLSTRFSKTYIENRRRCTYKEVQDVLDGKKTLGEKIDVMLGLCSKLRTILRNRRISEGALDLELNENEYLMGEKGEIDILSRGKRLESEEIVEEFMLLANRGAAEFLQKSGVGVYRIHEEPTPESSQEFWESAKKFGIEIEKSQKKGSCNPLKDQQKSRYQILLDSIADSGKKKILSVLLLRSLSKARYSEKNLGHYGLGFRLYTHFTSPIRRYSDLVVHRIISKILLNKKVLYSHKDLKKICKSVSYNEKKSEDAEREYKKIKTIRYLSSRIGEEFICMVQKITGFGMFIQEEERGIEGFVDNRWFEREEDGEINYAGLGKKIRVELLSLDPRRLHIDFKPVEWVK